MSNRPVSADGGGQGRVGRDAEDVGLVRVDRDALEALLDEVAEDAVRRTGAVRRCPDHGDPTGRAQDPLDARVVQDRDRPAPFLEVQEGRCTIAVVLVIGRSRLTPGPRGRTAFRRPPAGRSVRQRPTRTTSVTK